LEKILVPYDESGFSQKAFEKGLMVTEKFEAELIVLTVIQSKISDSGGISIDRLEKIQDEEDNDATEMLKKLEVKANAKNVSFTMKIIRNPSTSEGIVNFAHSNNVDLIVIGSHGRTGVRKLVLGSVANGVLSHVKCPVLVTKGE
jgi:nucleotide-binding universal stress UspA family protein